METVKIKLQKKGLTLPRSVAPTRVCVSLHILDNVTNFDIRFIDLCFINFQENIDTIYEDELIKVKTLRELTTAKLDYDSYILRIEFKNCKNKKLITKIDPHDKYDWIEFRLTYIRGPIGRALHHGQAIQNPSEM